MAPSRKTIIRLLEETQVGFTNAKTEEALKEKLIPEGYDDARLDELLGINGLLRTRFQAFEYLSAQQLKATDKLLEEFKKEMKEYSTSRQISRRNFSSEKYRGLRSELGLDQRISRDVEGFIEQATQYYEASLKNQESFKVKRVLNSRLSSETIQARLSALETLKKSNTEQEYAKGKANVAREERDTLFKELRMYWESFKIVCRNVFIENKEFLNILKIKPKKKRIPGKTPETPVIPPVPVSPVTPAPVTPAPGGNSVTPAGPVAPGSPENPAPPITPPAPAAWTVGVPGTGEAEMEE